MGWVTTTDVERFLAEAGDFLAADPVANTALLTETQFVAWLPAPPTGARFGWWREDGVTSAFVELPDHPVLCSPLDPTAARELPEVLGAEKRLGVQAQDESLVTQPGRTRPLARITLSRLETLRPEQPPDGDARVATDEDLPLLREWFALFQQEHPDDPSQVEFVVDHPLQAGSVVVWAVDGQPVAMASRTPRTSGMTRLGLAFQPAVGSTYADAAFAAACAQARQEAAHVLAFSGSQEQANALSDLGFVPVLDRVVLAVS